MKPYEEGYKLAENEWLLKIRPTDETVNILYRKPPTGFYAKLAKDGTLQKSFDDWGDDFEYDYSQSDLYHLNATRKVFKKLPIYVVEEKFRSGWKLHEWRFGQSQNWASLIHPDGYTLEVYLKDFLEIIKKHTLVNGELKYDLFKWDKHKLVKQEA